MSLKEYIRKRNFGKTAEPRGKVVAGKTHHFVVQKHEATRLHYDFRLGLDGTLKSWALPKGLPFEHGERHLAVHVEDHPVAYADFEGIIPKGQYGGGTVMVWDRGTFVPLTKSPLKDLENGKLHFELHGTKLEGEWYLVRLRKEENQWLIIRGGDSVKPPSRKADDTSALSGKTMKQLAKGERVWESKPKEASVKRISGRTRKALPVPEFVEPMKATLVDKAPAGKWLYEVKFDGWRALALKGGDETRLVSRNRKDFGEKFPEIVNAVNSLAASDAIIDGEIVALDPKGRSSFQLLQAYDIGSERPPLYYYVFDLLRLDGKDLRGLPLERRKELLEGLLASGPDEIRFSTSLGGNAETLLKKVKAMGLEGLIGKREGSEYEAGRRSGNWVKLKLLSEQEFVIGGFTEPEGARKHFGALLMGYYDKGKLVCCGKVGTGFDADLLKFLYEKFSKLTRKTCPFVNLPADTRGKWGQGITRAEMKFCHWLKPQLVAQVKFSEWTRDGRLRQPVFLGLREDKAASEVRRE